MALLGDMSGFTDSEREAAMRLFRRLESRHIAPIAIFALGPNGDTFALFNSRLEPRYCDQLGDLIDVALAGYGLRIAERTRPWPASHPE